FREAFAHVHRHRAAGDALWVSHPQVYEVYHGNPPALGAYSPADEVERRARAGRLWLVCTVTSGRGAVTAPGVVARVEAAGVALSGGVFEGGGVVVSARAAAAGTPSAGRGVAPADSGAWRPGRALPCAQPGSAFLRPHAPRPRRPPEAESSAPLPGPCAAAGA